MIGPVSIDHLVFRISAFDQTERFYSALFGPPTYQDKHSLMYVVGGTRMFFTLSEQTDFGTYNKERIGLNHIAFGVRTLAELEGIRSQLDSSKVSHSGIKLDQYGSKEFIWLDDPDGLRLEFYLRPE
jgi:glyoxylase I family protein